MNITPNPINNPIPQQNFTAIKRVKCNSAEFKYLLDNCKHAITSETREFFKNKSPIHCGVAELLIDTANKMGQSLEWIMQNCEHHGIKLPNINEAFLYDITGKDLFRLNMYKLKNVFRVFFYSLTNANKAHAEMPKHLANIKILNDFADRELPRFEKFLVKNNVEDVPYEAYKGRLEELEGWIKEFFEKNPNL